MAWAVNGTPATATGTVSTLEISDLDARKFNLLLNHSIATGTISTEFVFDNITTTTYAGRAERDGGADDLLTSQTSVTTGGDAADSFIVGYFMNITGESKLYIWFKVDASATGAGTPPSRREQYGKFTQSAQWTEIDMNDADTGSYLVDTNISMLGTD